MHSSLLHIVRAEQSGDKWVEIQRVPEKRTPYRVVTKYKQKIYPPDYCHTLDEAQHLLDIYIRSN